MTIVAIVVIRKWRAESYNGGCCVAHPDEAEGFEWDDDEEDEGNTTHLAKHAITPLEAEEVFYNDGRFVPNKRGMTGDWLLVGRTNGGRVLTLVITYAEDRRVIRFITGWNSTHGERARFLAKEGTRS
jgi:uncharacterized DUF497 family protein